MKIRVPNGTPSFTQQTLCATCENAHIVRGVREQDQITRCHACGMDPLVITFPVTYCNEYQDTNSPSSWELEKIAWRVTPDVRHPAGFRIDKPTKSNED